jgi:hypothetical protein
MPEPPEEEVEKEERFRKSVARKEPSPVESLPFA